MQDENINGNIEYSSLDNNRFWSYEGYEKIEKYVKASVFVSSGNHVIGGVDEYGNVISVEPDYYEIVIIELKDTSDVAVKEVEKYFENSYRTELDTFASYDIHCTGKYIYLLQYENYDNIEKVKDIMRGFEKK